MQTQMTKAARIAEIHYRRQYGSDYRDAHKWEAVEREARVLSAIRGGRCVTVEDLKRAIAAVMKEAN